ncbi:Plasma kallikrein, partial [Zancudomyces culisetae]
MRISSLALSFGFFAFGTPSALAKNNLKLEKRLGASPSSATRSLESRIIGGSNASLDDYKYIAYLSVVGRNEFKCTAELIAPNVVLAAAHCLSIGGVADSSKWDQIQVGFGAVKGTASDENTYSVKNVVIHPSYVNREPYNNDIALLFLEDCVDPDTAVPVEIDTNPVNKSDTFKVAGFGYTSVNGSPSTTLKELSLSLGRQDYCNALFAEDNAEGKIICLGVSAGSTVCTGDSGGPMVGSDGSKIQGISSSIITVNGKGCDAESTVAIYVLLSYYWDDFI